MLFAHSQCKDRLRGQKFQESTVRKQTLVKEVSCRRPSNQANTKKMPFLVPCGAYDNIYYEYVKAYSLLLGRRVSLSSWFRPFNNRAHHSRYGSYVVILEVKTRKLKNRLQSHPDRRYMKCLIEVYVNKMALIVAHKGNRKYDAKLRHTRNTFPSKWRLILVLFRIQYGVQSN